MRKKNLRDHEKAAIPQAITSALMLIVASLLLGTGCTMVKSETDVLGEYELKVGNGKIILTVLPDKSFTETIFWPNGKMDRRSGTWIWSHDGIGFDQLWIPSEFAPDYILQADASAKLHNQPKYTEPGYWWGRPEKHWGTVTLPVFPDADVSFNMIRKLRR